MSGPGAGRRTIERRASRETAPLSFAQVRAWLTDQLAGDLAYTSVDLYRIEGPLAVPILERAIGEIVRRHESLRTRFVLLGDEPIGLVGEPPEIRLEIEDHREVLPEDRQAFAHRAWANEARRRIDLARGPPFFTKLLRFGDGDHVLVFALHHIVADAWSFDVLAHELCQLYRDLSDGKSSSLPELSVQYGDFAAWQRERLSGANLERLIAFWRKQLEGAPAALNLPADGPRPLTTTFESAVETRVLSGEVGARLRDLARRHRGTFFMVLLAAYDFVLSRSSGQTDIVVGTPVVSRRAQTEPLIGLFFDTVVLRTDVAGPLTFRELLDRARATVLGAFGHQDLPFEKLVEVLRVPRVPGRNPLFQVLLNHVSAQPERRYDAGAVRMTRMAGAEEVGGGLFDQTLYARDEADGGITLYLNACRPLFSQERTRQVADQIVRLLEAVALDPDRRLDDAVLGEGRRSLPPRLSLPLDAPRSAQTTDIAVASRALTPDVFVRVEALAKSEDATPIMILGSALALLLARLSGQEGVVFGARRGSGPARESCALEIDLLEARTFRALLSSVRIEMVRARDAVADHSTLEVWLDESGDHRPEPPALLTLSMTARRDEARIVLLHRLPLLSTARVESMLDQLIVVLDQASAEPDRAIDRFSLVTPRARGMLPDPTLSLDEPHHEPVTAQIARRALESPRSTALTMGDRALTFGELEQQIERLARALMSRGIARGEVVAIFSPRSFGLITAIVGVMRAGAAFLTMDGKHPEERQRVMLREARVEHAVYVGPRRDSDRWLDEAGVHILEIDLDGASPDAPDLALPPIAPEDHAYVFFTSGTTGVPKAVLGWHKGLAHFIDWQKEAFAIGPGDRSAQLTGLSFNVLLRDVLTPLASGATLCLPPAAAEEIGPQTLRWLEREEITLLHSVPSVLQALVAHVPDGVELRRLRWIFSAGEPLLDTIVRDWRTAFPRSGGIALFYGQTETTLAKCCYRVPADPLHGAQPAGRSLPSSQALVLSPARQLCGVGEQGEVAIRTPFRTLGYMNAPAETAARFVPNPFREDPRDVVYLTGDRGRYRVDGDLEILGRTDDQLKIRGMRVEPRDIQVALAGHPGVQAAVVLAVESARSEKRLVAYWVPRKDPATDAHHLREDLRRQLPEFMIPSAFISIPALPLTPNGKLDRRALPPPTENAAAQHVAPRTEDEARLAQLWRGLLEIDDVGVEDNFFDVGGHSLMAIRLLAGIRSAFEVELSLADLFESRTVAKQASLIDRARHSAISAPVETRGPAPLSFEQEHAWGGQQVLRSTAFNSGTVLDISGPLDVVALRRALEEIIRRHEPLRTTVDTNDGLHQRVHPPGELPLSIVDLSSVPPDSRAQSLARVIEREQEVIFDLTREVLRGTLVRLGPEAHTLIWIVHHIAWDAWSVAVFCSELEQLYTAYTSGRSSPLADLPLSYSDYARRQRARVSGERLEQALSFWRAQFSGIPRLLLPLDHPRPTTPGAGPSAVEPVHLPRDLVLRLGAVTRGTEMSPYVLHLTAFALLLHQLSSQSEILVGSPITTRGDPGTERLIGMFMNYAIYRVGHAPGEGTHELLARVAETVQQVRRNRDVSWIDTFPAGTAQRPPFSVALNYVELTTPESGRFKESALPVLTRTLLHELDMRLGKDGDEIKGQLCYRSDLFLASTIRGFIKRFEAILIDLAS
jgi:amino acid adenylation domain-containing protein